MEVKKYVSPEITEVSANADVIRTSSAPATLTALGTQVGESIEGSQIFDY